MKLLLLLAGIAVFATTSNAAIVCTGTSALGSQVETTIDTQNQTVTVKVTEPIFTTLRKPVAWP